jgi:PAS domain S-box-containing protein
MGTSSILVGHYDYRLVALSVFISILAAFAALDLAERVTASRSGSRLAWLYGGAAAMGIGIWAMHYVGMVAFDLPVPVMYDWPTVVLSLLTAILASAVALFIVSRQTMGLARTAGCSVMMGSGIAAVHYIGMEAMRLQAMDIYSPGLVVLSVFLAVAISFVALQLAFAGRQDHSSWGRRKLWSGLILGAAIPIMHYVGMAAVRFMPEPDFSASLKHAVAITSFGLAAIIVATIIILGHVYAVSTINRRFSHQALQLTERAIQLKTIFDNLMEGIVVLDKRNSVVQINPAATRILGLPDGFLSLEFVREILEVHTLDGVFLPAEQWPSARGLRGEFVRNCELELRSGYTGRSAIVEISSAPIANAAGEPVQIILTFRDVTERKRTEEARARLVAIVESSQDAIIGKNLNGIVTSWNKGAENIFGYHAEEMIGQSIQCLLPPGQEYEEDGILERIRRGETVEQLDSERRRKDGRPIQVSLMISPIRDGSNAIVGASKIARDITERKLLERQWRQSQKMEAIGQLTGGIAHDFNNLLAIVIGNLGLLERTVAGNEAAMQRLKPAQKAAARGADLTRRLLALASKEELNPANTLIEDAIRETVELAGHALGPEIKILTHSAPSVPAVCVDGTGLESALLNLAVNARDAMPNGGTLTISTHMTQLDDSFPSVRIGEMPPGAYARISVSDTGHGMSKKTLERALEPFFTTKGRDKGTGLGLAMVYGFARQSGGTVRLYSELGHGTTVSLYLPLAGAPRATVREVPEAHFFVHTGGTVLVVDDEGDLQEIAHTYLTEMGYSALRADNAASALNAVALHKDIDLMITDIIMPGGMNGVELAEKARELSPGLKVIYSSGYPSDALIERNGTRIDGPMLRKPYHRADFEAIIQRTMGENRHSPELP